MGQINLKKTDSPNTPATGRVGLFISTLEVPKIIDDLGNESPLGGAVVFTDLTDVPNAYTGESGKVVTVKATEDGLEFTTPAGGGTVTSVAIAGTDGIEVDSGSPITGAGTITLGLNATTLKETTYPEAVERANNTVLFDQDYIIGNAGTRTGNILFDFTGAKLGATTEMLHDNSGSYTFPTEAVIRDFETTKLALVTGNVKFGFTLVNKTVSSEVVDIRLSLTETQIAEYNA